MKNAFLFERLAAPPEVLRQPPEAFDVEAAVAAQIQRIVATRPALHDFAVEALSFGMPAIVDIAHASQRELVVYAQRLEAQILHYEPRLLQPQVVIEPQADVLNPFCLIVSGYLASETLAPTLPIRLSLSIHSTR